MAKLRRDNFLHKFPPKKQNEQKFFCPFCAGHGKEVQLEKIVVLDDVYVEPGTEVYERVKRGNKWVDKLKYTTKTQEVFHKRVKRLRCPVCGLVYPIAQFFKKQKSTSV